MVRFKYQNYGEIHLLCFDCDDNDFRYWSTFMTHSILLWHKIVSIAGPLSFQPT